MNGAAGSRTLSKQETNPVSAAGAVTVSGYEPLVSSFRKR